MENVNDLKDGMDNLITKLELELSMVKQSRSLLNANPIPTLPTNGLVPNEQFLKEQKPQIKPRGEPLGITIPLINNNGNNNGPLAQNGRGRRRAEIPNVYPLHGSGTDKLRYILHTKNRAVSEREFYNEIVQQEGAGSPMLESLDRILRGMSHPVKGEWTYFTFTRKGLKFFILPEWRDAQTNTVIVPRRTDVTLSGLNQNECNWNQVIWHRDR